MELVPECLTLVERSTVVTTELLELSKCQQSKVVSKLKVVWTLEALQGTKVGVFVAAPGVFVIVGVSVTVGVLVGLPGVGLKVKVPVFVLVGLLVLVKVGVGVRIGVEVKTGVLVAGKVGVATLRQPGRMEKVQRLPRVRAIRVVRIRFITSSMAGTF
jgi:hypothetical protein